jgi:hypothetical protein
MKPVTFPIFYSQSFAQNHRWGRIATGDGWLITMSLSGADFFFSPSRLGRMHLT